MDPIEYNREAWNREVARGNRWTVPVDAATIRRARRGEWSVVLTGKVPVPAEWLGDITGKRLLCLASGGGQQGPVLAAAGADVTVFDLSDAQLDRDREVAVREGLSLKTVRGEMTDLSAFDDACFDLVFHPVSNCFVPDVRPVWREAFRVLEPGGRLLAGFLNPAEFLYDEADADVGDLRIRHKIPYSDLDRSEEQRRRQTEQHEPLCFGHTLQDQVGGQLDAGFLITGFYEHAHDESPLETYIDTYIATRAIKPAG